MEVLKELAKRLYSPPRSSLMMVGTMSLLCQQRTSGCRGMCEHIVDSRTHKRARQDMCEGQCLCSVTVPQRVGGRTSDRTSERQGCEHESKVARQRICDCRVHVGVVQAERAPEVESQSMCQRMRGREQSKCEHQEGLRVSGCVMVGSMSVLCSCTSARTSMCAHHCLCSHRQTDRQTHTHTHANTSEVALSTHREGLVEWIHKPTASERERARYTLTEEELTRTASRKARAMLRFFSTSCPAAPFSAPVHQLSSSTTPQSPPAQSLSARTTDQYRYPVPQLSADAKQNKTKKNARNQSTYPDLVQSIAVAAQHQPTVRLLLPCFPCPRSTRVRMRGEVGERRGGTER
eukprot:3942000-Rhodomonas_salina.3